MPTTPHINNLLPNAIQKKYQYVQNESFCNYLILHNTISISRGNFWKQCQLFFLCNIIQELNKLITVTEFIS